MNEIMCLVRPELLELEGYSSPRTVGDKLSISLAANESPFAPFPPSSAESAGLNRYPEQQPRELLGRLSSLYSVPPEQLLITRGAAEGIDLIVRCFCAAGRDAIAINVPTFELYGIAAQIQGLGVHPILLRADDHFQLDVQAIRERCRSHTNIKLVFLCTPNNPTGGLLRRRDVLSLSTSLLGRALVVADETYLEFSSGSSLCSELDMHPNLVVLRTLSKAYGLAGARCGVAIAHPDVIDVLRRILAPFPMTNGTVRAVLHALSSEGIAHAHSNIQAVVAERERIAEHLRASPAVARVLPSDANYLLVETAEPRLLVTLMEREGVRIRDRSHLPELEGCVRITIGTRDENDVMLTVFDKYAAVLGAPDLTVPAPARIDRRTGPPATELATGAAA